MRFDRALGHRRYPQQALPPPVRHYHGMSEVYEIRSKEDKYFSLPCHLRYKKDGDLRWQTQPRSG